MLTLRAANPDLLWRGGFSLRINRYCTLGAVISPLLANVYLQYVLDLWANQSDAEKSNFVMISDYGWGCEPILTVRS